MKIMIYVAVVLFAGVLLGACLGVGLSSGAKPSPLWAVPFTVVLLAGIVLGAYPFAPR